VCNILFFEEKVDMSIWSLANNLWSVDCNWFVLLLSLVLCVCVCLFLIIQMILVCLLGYSAYKKKE
jgi:hypothetical protein